MRKPGKKVGTCIYVHRQYREAVIPQDAWDHALHVLGGEEPEGYTGIKYDRKKQSLTFQWSPDFDTAPEPTVGLCIMAQWDGTMRVMHPPKDPMIWHHKWLWVADDYKGFDVEESKARSELWKPYVSGVEKKRIGRKSFWESIRKRWESV